MSPDMWPRSRGERQVLHHEVTSLWNKGIKLIVSFLAWLSATPNVRQRRPGLREATGNRDNRGNRGYRNNNIKTNQMYNDCNRQKLAVIGVQHFRWVYKDKAPQSSPWGDPWSKIRKLSRQPDLTLFGLTVASYVVALHHELILLLHSFEDKFLNKTSPRRRWVCKKRISSREECWKMINLIRLCYYLNNIPFLKAINKTLIDSEQAHVMWVTGLIFSHSWNRKRQ